MTEPSCPPPPPGMPASRTGLHGPETKFFRGLRARLSSLEQVPLPSVQKNLRGGLLVSLILAAVVGFLLSYFVQLALIPLGTVTIVAVFAPLTEEPFKAVGMLIVAFLMWKFVPNRRIGVAIGAAAGLGFAVAEDILYFSQFYTLNAGVEAYLLRILLLPFMHPVWSAFVGIGVFVLVAGKSKTGNISLGLPLLFLFLGIINHMVWNSIAVTSAMLPELGYWPIVVDVFVIFPIFALVLRDLLGGHFNFQNFFQTLSDSTPEVFTIAPPPPPPPTT